MKDGKRDDKILGVGVCQRRGKMLAQYFTIKEEAEAEITIKKSKFIATAFPMKAEQELEEKISFIKKKYRDAKHYVFAYRLSNGAERYSDDGEPNKTAGLPILDILRGNHLYDVLIVVTRYFGGVLLGTGGLVKAYSDVAKQTLEKASKQIKFLCVRYQLKIPYNDYQIVQHWCSSNHFTIDDVSFSEMVTIQLIIKKEEEKVFFHQIQELLEGSAEITKIQDEFYI